MTNEYSKDARVSSLFIHFIEKSDKKNYQKGPLLNIVLSEEAAEDED